MGLPRALMEKLKDRARDRGIPYTRLIRSLIEQEINHR